MIEIFLLAILYVVGTAAFSPEVTSDRVVIRTYSLVGPGIGDDCTLHEVRRPPRDPNVEVEEDDVELYYDTSRRAFSFPRHGEKVLEVRQTSFGCGRLGATVWPSAIALSCLLANDLAGSVEGKRVLELGSGCGLPSVVAKEICSAGRVLATDHWEEVEEDGTRKLPSLGDPGGDRLVPRDLFGSNLAYNLGSDADVRRMDWHDETGVIEVANDFRPDLIVGSDLLYYPTDVTPLLRTLRSLLRAGGDDDGRARREALLMSPISADTEREALPELRTRLEDGELGDDCEVEFDEPEMLEQNGNGGEERRAFLRMRIRRSP